MTFLEKICNQLNAAELSYALVGGYAAAFHGAKHSTVAIDIVLKWQKTSLEVAFTILNSLGLSSRLPITASELYAFRQEYIKNKQLTACSFYNPEDPSEQLNIIITYDLHPNKVECLEVNNTSIPLLKLSELVKMQEASAEHVTEKNIDSDVNSSRSSIFWFADAYKSNMKKYANINPYDVALYLDNFRLIQTTNLNTMMGTQTNTVKKRVPSKLISLKVPVDLLNAFKSKSKLENVRYQTQIKRLMMNWLENDRASEEKDV
ncbi:MAG: hypothetical protein ACJAUP_000511 [Cellvibrionaceae bacterium]|jgi:hypothetical protein